MEDQAVIRPALMRSPSLLGAVGGFVADYIALTKPKITVLLLISTICPMFLAAGGGVSFRLALLTLIGGTLLTASASVMNCIYDRDIDAVMERTKNRPLAAGRVTPTSAFVYSLFLGFVGFFVLYFEVNPLSAFVGLFGHLFYVLVYTMWLKRSTVQNIVIGGAAGAVPPIVGWAAVTGSVDHTALLLFLLIFLWTPPHFWALALNKNADYRRANVPMLPVVAGEEPTHRQMLWYALSLIPVSLLLVAFTPALGIASLFLLVGLSVLFAFKVYQLKSGPVERRTQKAWDVFGFSLIYLALFFVCLVVDSTIL